MHDRCKACLDKDCSFFFTYNLELDSVEYIGA